jgi:hypothetical protein
MLDSFFICKLNTVRPLVENEQLAIDNLLPIKNNLLIVKIKKRLNP